MTEILPVLKRIGCDNDKKHRLLLLDKDEITIGRAMGLTYKLPSAFNMISRKHASVRKVDDKWNIFDHKSLNGILLNGKKIEAERNIALNDGDKIQFGVPNPGEKIAEYVYIFYSCVKVKRQRPKSFDETDSSQKHSRKRAKLADDTQDQQVSSSQPDPGPSCSDPLRSAGSPKWSPCVEYENKMKEHDEEMKKKMDEYETRLAEMQARLSAKEEEESKMKSELEEEKKRKHAQKELIENLKEKEEKMKKDFEEKQDKMIKEKQEAEDKIRRELIDQLENKEKSLVEQLREQRKKLKNERKDVESKLKLEMEKALKEKDKDLQQKLMKEKEKLDTELSRKEMEQKLLESQLNDTKQENTKHKEEALQAREDVLSNFADLMETELQCSICNELFIRATSLTCSHSFCEACILQWMKVKRECPICRAIITTHMRSIVLDSYIDKMIEHLSDDMKQQRKQLIDARKKAEEQKKKPAGRGRGRGGARTRTARARGGGAARGRGLRTAAPQPETVVVSSDNDDNDDLDEQSLNEMFNDSFSNESNESFSDSTSDSTDSDSSHSSRLNSSDSVDSEIDPWAALDVMMDMEERNSRPYYGGYGSCYRCGQVGHWANGCPFR